MNHKLTKFQTIKKQSSHLINKIAIRKLMSNLPINKLVHKSKI